MSAKIYQRQRNRITMDGEIASLRKLFQTVKDKRASNASHKLDDTLMIGYAIFALKYPSVLSFEQQSIMDRANLKSVYGIDKICSDTQLREILDPIDPQFIRDEFAEKFKTLRKTGLVKEFAYKIGGTKYHIISSDGVQHFSSKQVSCPCCLEKKHKNGTCTYHHNMLCAALVHPEKREVFLMDVEPIIQQDGLTKNDSELNAGKRLQENLHKQYKVYQKQYNFLIVEDALYANGPHINILKDNNFDYILNVKPKGHKTLFKSIAGKRRRKELKTYTYSDKGITHEFEYINNVVLNNSHPDIRVNFIHYTQTDNKGKKTVFSWITSIKLSKDRLMPLMRAGRSRWKIENEAFNTLKNLGYNFMHNFGHGDDHLSTMFAYLMLMAFYVDQLIQSCCHIFQQIEANFRTKVKLWESIKAIFHTTPMKSMNNIYFHVAKLYGFKLKVNSS